VSAVLAGVIYFLGWAGPQAELFTTLNVLGLVTMVGFLGLGRTAMLAWAALTATLAALVGLASLARLNGAGILAVMSSVPACATATVAWFALCGRAAWLPATLFPPVSRRSPVPERPTSVAG
jgi:hypothetical protein